VGNYGWLPEKEKRNYLVLNLEKIKRQPKVYYDFFLFASYNKLKKKKQPQQNHLIMSQLGTQHLKISIPLSFQSTLPKI
jgi:hypothetical protein